MLCLFRPGILSTYEGRIVLIKSLNRGGSTTLKEWSLIFILHAYLSCVELNWTKSVGKVEVEQEMHLHTLNLNVVMLPWEPDKYRPFELNNMITVTTDLSLLKLEFNLPVDEQEDDINDETGGI
nr:unnamed protein product [Callosobruchus analis]